jgi:hypothetical protein
MSANRPVVASVEALLRALWFPTTEYLSDDESM